MKLGGFSLFAVREIRTFCEAKQFSHSAISGQATVRQTRRPGVCLLTYALLLRSSYGTVCELLELLLAGPSLRRASMLRFILLVLYFASRSELVRVKNIYGCRLLIARNSVGRSRRQREIQRRAARRAKLEAGRSRDGDAAAGRRHGLSWSKQAGRSVAGDKRPRHGLRCPSCSCRSE